MLIPSTITVNTMNTDTDKTDLLMNYLCHLNDGALTEKEIDIARTIEHTMELLDAEYFEITVDGNNEVTGFTVK